MQGNKAEPRQVDISDLIYLLEKIQKYLNEPDTTFYTEKHLKGVYTFNKILATMARKIGNGEITLSDLDSNTDKRNNLTTAICMLPPKLAQMDIDVVVKACEEKLQKTQAEYYKSFQEADAAKRKSRKKAETDARMQAHKTKIVGFFSRKHQDKTEAPAPEPQKNQLG